MWAQALASSAAEVKTAIHEDLVRALDLPSGCITIVSIRSGSLIVDFSVSCPPSGLLPAASTNEIVLHMPLTELSMVYRSLTGSNAPIMVVAVNSTAPNTNSTAQLLCGAGCYAVIGSGAAFILTLLGALVCCCRSRIASRRRKKKEAAIRRLQAARLGLQERREAKGLITASFPTLDRITSRQPHVKAAHQADVPFYMLIPDGVAPQSKEGDVWEFEVDGGIDGLPVTPFDPYGGSFHLFSDPDDGPDYVRDDDDEMAALRPPGNPRRPEVVTVGFDGSLMRDALQLARVHSNFLPQGETSAPLRHLASSDDDRDGEDSPLEEVPTLLISPPLLWAAPPASLGSDSAAARSGGSEDHYSWEWEEVDDLP
jgi:hypothetical protein